MGWQEGSVNPPGESSLALRKKKMRAASTLPLPWSHGTSYPKVFQAGFLPLRSAFTLQGTWARGPAGHMEVEKGD